MLTLDININNYNENGETVLLYCCKNDIFEPVVSLLSVKNIDVNKTDKDMKTAAMYLAEKGRFTEFKNLNFRNCNYNYINIKGESVISTIIKNMYSIRDNSKNGLYVNYINMITYLVHIGGDFNLRVDEDKNTAVMAFMLLKDFQTFKYILDNSENIDLSLKNKHGESVTSLTFKLNEVPYINSIINNNTFDYEYIDSNKNTLLMLCSIIDQPIYIKNIINHNKAFLNCVNKRKENALIISIKLGNLNSALELIKNSIDINQQDILGNTALHYAVYLKKVDIIKELIKQSIDIKIKNNNGKTGLDLAKEIGNQDILNLFNNTHITTTHTYSEVEENVIDNPDIQYKETLKNINIPIKNIYYNIEISKILSSLECTLYKVKMNNNKMNYGENIYNINLYDTSKTFNRL